MEDVYKSYYTKSDPIISYMIKQLSLEEKMKVFEPCAGDGVFIDALNSIAKKVFIDIFELNPEALEILNDKYSSFDNIHIKKGDTLTNEDLSFLSNSGGFYDRIIANPPYGGWQDYEKRKYLKTLYPSLYVKETYALFLYRCVKLLANKGILVFIIPDTFLNLHMHTKLRDFLLTNTKIKELCLFPSSFFPGVNFGYSNLCIITIERCSKKSECLKNQIKVITGLKNVEELNDLEDQTKHRTYVFNQGLVHKNIDHALFVSENPEITHLINNCEKRISDVADCVTGFYSGNDKNYLKAGSKKIKNSKKYEIVDKSKIYESDLNDILGGIKGSKHFIPILKGGAIKYFKPDLWYMDWGINAVKEYKVNKKSRFQNSEFYFKYGIGVPMVSSSAITAALIENKLFDQSIVGIFPKNLDITYYLLAFFNSPTCNKLIRTINPSANNSANYIKKIPYIEPSEKNLEKINYYSEKILSCLKQNKKYPPNYENKINEIIKNIYNF